MQVRAKVFQLVGGGSIGLLLGSLALTVGAILGLYGTNSQMLQSNIMKYTGSASSWGLCVILLEGAGLPPESPL